MEPTVSISFVTTAQTAGAQQAVQSTKQVTAATQQATSATQQQTTATRQQTAATQQATTVNAQHVTSVTAVGNAAGTAAGKGLNFGQAMLQGSRGIQDMAAAGLPGVVNNLEGLATALGLGAGAAGGVTLIAVAVDLLVRNWDKLKGLFGSTEEVQALWTALTPEEQHTERMKNFTDALERQTELLERQAEARKQSAERMEKERELLATMSEAWAKAFPEVKKDQETALPPLPGMGADSDKMTAAKGTAAAAGEDYAQRAAAAIQADNAFKAQQERIRLMERRELLRRQKEAQDAADRDAIENMPSGPDRDANIASLRGRISQRQADFTKQTSGLPMPFINETSDDPQKQAEITRRAIQQERDKLEALRATVLARGAAAQTSGEAFKNAQAGVDRVQREEANASAAQAFGAGGTGLPPAPGMFPGLDSLLGIGQQTQQMSQRIADNLQSVANPHLQAVTHLAGGIEHFTAGVAAELATVQGLVKRLEARVDAIKSRPSS